MVTDRSIIFFDIDGTLLTEEERTLPESAKKAIFKLKELGHEVAISTGRAKFLFEDLRKELGIDTYICYNGQYVVFRGEVIFANTLNKESLNKLTTFALNKNHPVVYMNDKKMTTNVPNDHPYIEESISTLKLGVFPTHEQDFEKYNEIYQGLLFNTEGEDEIYRETFSEFDFIRWHPKSLDILPKGISKAIGIKKLLEYLDFPAERQYAFGDALNDIEMLQLVPNGVAMGNALPEVKDVAAFVTKDVSDDGILYGLQHLGLLPEE
ncbi:Cof-type HAD-IIB family hydrolase [Oceanobacillus jeddahense]|uniref:Cof-type HAD-IIB family hydrolase n=1 Tax=Oceanobacillus jeddahense TaxID=1462527 RepID=A0ABY5JPL7_9BACI|nr:Cof-type HAD-IIB family hydrolase [Oceanobacillus jeddahense]UUI02237.1 Cof-type HAD-IIB family hydrolase [Oceanobacillus jeddahense]